MNTTKAINWTVEQKYPSDYNIRNERPKVVTGEKRDQYDMMEEKRGLYENELSSNYWVIK